MDTPVTPPDSQASSKDDDRLAEELEIDEGHDMTNWKVHDVSMTARGITQNAEAIEPGSKLSLLTTNIRAVTNLENSILPAAASELGLLPTENTLVDYLEQFILFHDTVLGEIFYDGIRHFRDIKLADLIPNRPKIDDKIPAPQPDIVFGYHSSSFPPEFRGLFEPIEPIITKFALLGRFANFLPFLVVEAKLDGPIYDAEQQARRDGAALVNSLELYSMAFTKSLPAPEQSCVFSLTCSPQHFTLWVHHRRGDFYDMTQLCNGRWNAKDNVQEIKLRLRGISDWARGERWTWINQVAETRWKSKGYGTPPIVVAPRDSRRSTVKTSHPIEDDAGRG